MAAKKRTQRAPKGPKPLDLAKTEPVASAVPVASARLDALEAAHGPLPAGYREFMSRLGAGEYGGAFYVYPPDRVAAFTKENGAFIRSELELWENADEVLAKGAADRLVFLAHTTAGELGMLAFVAGAPDQLLFFPRPSLGCRVERMGPTFLHAAARLWPEDD